MFRFSEFMFNNVVAYDMYINRSLFNTVYNTEIDQIIDFTDNLKFEKDRKYAYLPETFSFLRNVTTSDIFRHLYNISVQCNRETFESEDMIKREVLSLKTAQTTFYIQKLFINSHYYYYFRTIKDDFVILIQVIHQTDYPAYLLMKRKSLYENDYFQREDIKLALPFEPNYGIKDDHDFFINLFLYDQKLKEDGFY